MCPSRSGFQETLCNDIQNFRRGYEPVLVDAICKNIEAQTPYKIVSDRDLADTVLSGQLSVGEGVLSHERYTGQTIENEVVATVSVSWKNLKTGELLLENASISASVPYSEQLGQQLEYASSAALNKAAVRVVELMEEEW